MVNTKPIMLACHGGSLLVSDERVVRRGEVAWALWRSQITGVGCAYVSPYDSATIYIHVRDSRRFAVAEVAPRECFVLFGLLGYEAEPIAPSRIGGGARAEEIELGDRRHTRITADARGVTLEQDRVVAWTLPRWELAGVNVSAGARDAVVQVIARFEPVALLDEVPFAAALRLLLVLGAALATPTTPVPAAATEALQESMPLPAVGAGPRATNAPRATGRPRATNTPTAPAGPRATNAPPALGGTSPAMSRARASAPAATTPPLPDASSSYRLSQGPPPRRAGGAARPRTADDLLVFEPTMRLPAPRVRARRRHIGLGLGTAALLLLAALVLAVYGGDFVGLGGALFAPRPTPTGAPPATPIPSMQPSPTPIPSPTATHAPSPTPKPAPTATHKPAPTSKPAPTAAPSVSPSP